MIRILLDTTFLLPLFGIRVRNFGLEDLKKLLDSNYILLFNPISLVEIRWVGAKLVRNGLLDKKKFTATYIETVDYLLNSEEMKPTPLITSEIALYESKLEEIGIDDYFDRIISSTAKIFADILLTEDRDLTNKLKSFEEFNDLVVIDWRSFLQKRNR